MSAPALATLPRVVVSRLLLVSVQEQDGGLRTRATYRVEGRESSLIIVPPPGATLQAVRVNGAVVDQVEPLTPTGTGTGGFRVPLSIPAASPAGASVVDLDFVVPAVRGRGAWGAPRLLGDAVVQQTLWKVRTPWNRAVVGVPAGWSDENEWYWDRYLWKRRPWAAPAALAAWVGLPQAGLHAEPSPKADEHEYLFGRAGGPIDLPVTVASRAWLVALCSGAVLLVGGLLPRVWRPPLRWLAVAVPCPPWHLGRSSTRASFCWASSRH